MAKKSSNQQQDIQITSDTLNQIKQKKLATIKNIFKDIDKKTGDTNSVFLLKDRQIGDIQSFSSGSMMLDIALGCNGIPLGRLIEISGLEASGKSLTMLKAVAEAQKAGYICAWLDCEQTYSPDFAAKFGVCNEELLLAQPDNLENTFIIIEELVQTGMVNFIVLDSISSVGTKAEIEAEIGKNNIGLVARATSSFLRRINPQLARNNCTLAIISQLRANIGVLYGNPYTTTSGNSVRFYASIRMEASKLSGSQIKEKINGEEIQVGHRIKIRITKNKVGPPFKTANFLIYYDGRQTDIVDELTDIIVQNELIPKVGADGNPNPKGLTYKFELDDEKISTRRAGLADALRKCPKIQQYFIDMIKSGNYTVSTQMDKENNNIEDETDNIEKEITNSENNFNEAEEIESF